MFARRSKLFEFVILIVLMLLLQACAAVQGYSPVIVPGDVLPLATGSTLRGMQLAVNGGLETFRMTKDLILTDGSVVKNGLLMLAWPERGCGAWCFVLIDTSAKTFVSETTIASVKGNLINGKDMTAIISYMRDQCGWRELAAAEITPAVKAAIVASGGQSTWVTLASRVPIFMIVFDSPTTDPFFTVSESQQ